MTEKTIITIPRGATGLAPKQLDLSKVCEAETLIPEIQATTSVKAPYLLAVFNEAYNSLVDLIRVVDLEVILAHAEANKRRSILILDEMKEILEKKGLTKATNPLGSEDIRRAVLECDQEYINLTNKVQFLEATAEYLRNKLKVMDKSENAVKKILGDQQPGHRLPSYGTDRSGGVEETPVGMTAPRAGFARPK